MIPQARILLVEDERTMSHLIDATLTRQGYRVLLAADGETGLQLACDSRPDLVVLDVGLPVIDGFAVCRRLRELEFDAPILMLTGKSMLADRVAGLNSGADDYLAKPFQPEEFLARINALLRRRRRDDGRSLTLELDGVCVDLGKQIATRDGRPLALTKTEFALLELLARHAGEPVARETMLDIVWGVARYPSTRTIDTHIWRLRKKLGDDGAAPRWLRPVHGRGYSLEATAISKSRK